MASMMDMLTEQLGGGTLKQMSGLLGSDEKTTGSAVSAALPVLLGALARNSSKPEGAESLFGALQKDHDGSVLDDVPGSLSRADTGPGDGILRHVLGPKRNSVEAGIGKATGMDGAAVGKLMTMLAPMVMGMLGRQQRQQRMDSGSLAGFLGSQVRETESKTGLGGLMGLLDRDHDGDISDDIAKLGGGVIKKLFGGK